MCDTKVLAEGVEHSSMRSTRRTMVLCIMDDSCDHVQCSQSEPLIAEAAWSESMNCRWFSSPNDGGGANLRSSLRVLLARISRNSLRSRRAVLMPRGQHPETNKISRPQELPCSRWRGLVCCLHRGFGCTHNSLEHGWEDEVVKRQDREPVEATEESLGSKFGDLFNRGLVTML